MTGLVATGVLFRTSGGFSPATIFMVQVFPTPALPYNNILSEYISTWPCFIDCSNSLRDSLVPRDRGACVEYGCVSPVDEALMLN